MYTVKIVTANQNEILHAAKSLEWKAAEKTIYADEHAGESLTIALLPGDTAYVVNGNNRTVATYTNPADH
ncbi:hypothetical protein CLM71_08700 [Serratia sp. MYb239]|uniref:hypothetical protein n=1 Tax=Serratia sp. MYb239 TaxID=2033438 RepID=UPI000CF66154|nr:hypothetical protein [Serratia sp. MYb239]AVJ17204.1 hypothetical protein CLM71_08700 [Serratia sp. MYb239]